MDRDIDQAVAQAARFVLTTAIWFMAFVLVFFVATHVMRWLDRDARACRLTFQSVDQYGVMTEVCRDPQVRRAILEWEEKNQDSARRAPRQ